MLIGVTQTFEACADYGLANILIIVQRIMTIFQIIVPIIAIVALIKIFIKLVANPEEKKLKNSIRNWTIALVVFFFLPLIIQLTVNLMAASGIDRYGQYKEFSFKACWDAAKDSSMFSSNKNSE